MSDQAITASLVKLLRKLSGQENCYTIPKLYVELTRCHVRALILNQLVFYSDKSTRHEAGWFDKPYEEWEQETYVKERTLRNILKEFKEKNWCESKVKLVNGKTTLCCKPNLENILSDIKTILDNDTPGKICRTPRKNLPNPPEKFAVPSITDNYTDKNTDMCGETPSTPFFSDYKSLENNALQNANECANKQKAELEAIEDAKNQALFKQRFQGRDVTIEEIFKGCQEYYSQKGGWVGTQRFAKWIRNENPENYAKIGSHQSIKKISPKDLLSNEDKVLLDEYRHWVKTASHVPLEKWMPNEEKRNRAILLFAQEQEFIRAMKEKKQA